jgi:predicted Zn-dependent protease
MKRAILLVGVAILSIGAKKRDDDPYALPAASQMTAGDKQTGAKAHPEILNEFGGAFEAPQAAYVRTVGQKIALQSGLSGSASDFTVTLLNSNVDNAFAIPGGYVYVTRQLMALMNNEAELASVLGHEVGHVAARHGASRQKRATTGGLLATGATILGAVLGGNTGAQLGQQLGQVTSPNSRARRNIKQMILAWRILPRRDMTPSPRLPCLLHLQRKHLLIRALPGVVRATYRNGPFRTLIRRVACLALLTAQLIKCG